MAVENYEKRSKEKVKIPKGTVEFTAGFSAEAIISALGGNLDPLLDAIKVGRIRGIAALVGCNNPKVEQDRNHVEMTRRLIEKDVLVVETGCSAIANAKAGLMLPEAAEKAGEVLGFPIVDKPPIGSWGRLVTLVRDHQSLRSVIEHRELLQSQLIKTHLIQKYINGGNRDLRILVLGEEVLGGMRRIAALDDWRSNVARGGKVEAIKLDSELTELSLKTAEVIGGEFIAIDLFEESEGYLVNEVNGVPEFKGFMKATRVNVAEKLAEYVRSILKR